jgi:hypothetical protein
MESRCLKANYEINESLRDLNFLVKNSLLLDPVEKIGMFLRLPFRLIENDFACILRQQMKHDLGEEEGE